MPHTIIWDTLAKDEYPDVKVYANKMKLTLMAAYNALLTGQVKQTVQANRRQKLSPFETEDLIYIWTKNISFSKGMAYKPKKRRFIGPYQIVKDFGNHSYQMELPDDLKWQGVHNIFHFSLLRIHAPNDD